MADRRRRCSATVVLRRSVRTEAAAWGLMVALTTAFVPPLLIERGATPLELGVYNAGVNLGALGLAWLGPWWMARSDGMRRPTLSALRCGRGALAAAALLFALPFAVPAPLLIGILIAASAGEGIAQPLWLSLVGDLAPASGRGAWLAWRATVAARAIAVALPPLALLALVAGDRAARAALALAAVAGWISVGRVRTIMAESRPPPALPARSIRSSSRRLEPRFLFGVAGFWFGAALNQPVLPVHLVRDLGAPAAYFALAAAVAAVAGPIAQERWGVFGNARGAQALLARSGVVAGIVPLLWLLPQSPWFGLPIEAIAAGCWLGHLLGLTLSVTSLARDAATRSRLAARIALTQGVGAAVGPVVGGALVGRVGAAPLLAASGVVCLGSAAIMTDQVPRLSVMGSAARRVLAPPLCPACRGVGCAVCVDDVPWRLGRRGDLGEHLRA